MLIFPAYTYMKAVHNLHYFVNIDVMWGLQLLIKFRLYLDWNYKCLDIEVEYCILGNL